MRNPLIRRIPKELASDWHKYLVIVIFMVGMIGVISGMYVGRESMIASIESGKTKLNLEDGSFELSHRASPELLENISSGKKADVRQYFIDQSLGQFQPEFTVIGPVQLDSAYSYYGKQSLQAESLRLKQAKWQALQTLQSFRVTARQRFSVM